MLKAMGFQRNDVYISNLVKCRTSENKEPSVEEVAACESYLIRQIKLIQPDLILALGSVTAQRLLKSKSTLGRLRGSRTIPKTASGRWVKKCRTHGDGVTCTGMPGNGALIFTDAMLREKTRLDKPARSVYTGAEVGNRKPGYVDARSGTGLNKRKPYGMIVLVFGW